jgi:cobalt-zinc-cadmium efflux system membrane fusion protein
MQRTCATALVLAAVLCGCGGSAEPPATPARPAAAPRVLEAAPEAVAKLNVALAAAVRKAVARRIDVVGTVGFDEDRLAIAGPRLLGRIVGLGARPGQTVQAGDLLAELESADLAKREAQYLGQQARARAAAANARREQDLHRRQVSSAREREVAVAEAEALEAEANVTKQLLFAMGLSQEELPTEGGDRALARFTVRAPLAGVVVDRPVVLGESVDVGQTIAKVADLSRVWVNLDVFERDLAWVRVGLPATLHVDAFPDMMPKGTVRFVRPQIDSTTRTARVQLDVENPAGLLLPGQFVTATLVSETPGPPVLTVPRNALEMLDGKDVVFVGVPGGGLAVREVGVGSRGSEDVEIRTGLVEGDSVAVSNTFLLKAEVLR